MPKFAIAGIFLILVGTSFVFFMVFVLTFRSGEEDWRWSLVAVSATCLGAWLALTVLDNIEKKTRERKEASLRDRTEQKRKWDEEKIQEIEALSDQPSSITIQLPEGASASDPYWNSYINCLLATKIRGKLVCEGGVWVREIPGQEWQIVSGWKGDEPMPERRR